MTKTATPSTPGTPKTRTVPREVKELQEATKKNSESLAAMKKSIDTVADWMKKTPDPKALNPDRVFGAPTARRGENSLSSRGFSFTKLFGVLLGQLEPEDAKVEFLEVGDRLHKAYVKSSLYDYSPTVSNGRKVLAPLSSSFMQEDIIPRDMRQEFKALVNAGMDGADQDEMSWLRGRQIKSLYGQKTLSWLNEFTGGSLVAPPEMGELIELLRNKEALVNAGARTVPLPPQGRMKFPRQTAPSLTYWVGENSPITDSNIGTGEIVLQAKKLAVMIKVPNELIRFASPATEALIRDDMTKSLALGLDLACLEGQGGDNRPRGVINFPNINRITSSAPLPGGDRIVGQDIYRFVAAVEESNAEFEGWIMRPKTLFKYYQLRADSVSQSDSAGPFLFNLIREAGMDTQATIAGFPVTKSTQVSQSRSKGGTTNLTYILGGMWSDCLIGMFGAIEFAATTMGDTPFTFDQTWVRGILSADFQIRHEAAFVLMDSLDTTI